MAKVFFPLLLAGQKVQLVRCASELDRSFAMQLAHLQARLVFISISSLLHI